MTSQATAQIPARLKALLDKFDSTREYSGRLPKITSSSGRSYFVKIGDPGDEEQYHGEAESLKDMKAAAPGLAPQLYDVGTFDDGKPYWISEYKDLRPLTSAASIELAKRLAMELHQYKSGNGFGFQVPNYCGPTRFANGWYDTWEECYSAMYGTLINRLREEGNYGRLCSIGDTVMKRQENVFLTLCNGRRLTMYWEFSPESYQSS